MQRTCVFCGKPGKLEREHIISDWISDSLKLAGLTPPIKHEMKSGERIIVWIGANRLEVAPKCVCRTCNGGWMSDLEVAVRPVLEPLLYAKERTVSPAEQTLIATWLAVKAVAVRYGLSPPEPLEQSWRRWIYTHREPPPTWYAWLGLYGGPKPASLEHRAITIDTGALQRPVVVPPTPNGLLLTVTIGALLLQIIGINGGYVRHPGPPGLARIWPPPHHVIEWPPFIGHGDATLQGIRESLLGPPNPVWQY